MNYQETINWMFNQLPMYQLQGASAYKKDLTNAYLLSNHLENPEKNLKCIHVAGTNGKGSTSHILASIFQEAGYKVGLYTSPHLRDYRERIKINGIEISEEFVCDFINKNKAFFEANDMSFFEMTVGLAFDYFAKEKVDIAIIEVGMGGRLDATNIITPLVSVITDVVGIGDAPDGRNINAGVGSEHPDQLAARVRAEGARLGIAHDGDGDRCVLCDEQGGVLDGDEILTILATHALAHGRLANNLLVATQQSNLGLDAVVAAAGGRVMRTQIGDRYVVERMLAQGAQLGGESSGHIICADVSSTGDGLMAALKVIMVMRETGRPLSELRRRLVKFPQLTAALKVKEKTPLAALPRLSATIRAVETELGERGRVLVRYSGTESKLRLLVEGPTDVVVRDALARLGAAVRAELTVLP